MSGRRANGEGTIYPRKDGRYEGAAYVLTTDGTRRRIRVYGHTREEAAGKLTELMAQHRRGMPAVVNAPTVASYLAYWLPNVAKPRVRPLTYRTYEMFVREHIVPALGKKRLDRLTARDIRTFLASRSQVASRSPGRRSRPLSQRTVFHLHAVLRNALADAVREDLIVRNVAQQVQVSPGHQEEVVPLTVEEARTLLRGARADRLYALYAVALSVGLRRGEALGLRWSDVDLDAGVLQVRQTLQRHSGALHFAPPKTRRSRRTVPLLPSLAATLREHRERQAEERARAGDAWTDSGLVFTTATGTPIEPNDFSKKFVRMCERAGVRRVRLHDLRHTCASMLLAQGVPPRVVMEVLGHSAIEVTMTIYGHVMVDAQRAALAGMDELLSDDEPSTDDD